MGFLVYLIWLFLVLQKELVYVSSSTTAKDLVQGFQFHDLRETLVINLKILTVLDLV